MKFIYDQTYLRENLHQGQNIDVLTHIAKVGHKWHALPSDREWTIMYHDTYPYIAIINAYSNTNLTLAPTLLEYTNMTLNPNHN